MTTTMQKIERIAGYVMACAKDYDLKINKGTVIMDLSACHSKCELDFDKLATFDDPNLLHDVLGINKHLNRETYELENCFLPRCARKERND